MEKGKPAISPLGAVLIVIATFFLSVFGSVFFLIVLGTSAAMILGELLLIVLPLIYMNYKKIDIGTYIGLRITPKMILLGIAFAVFLFFFDLFVIGTIISVIGESEAMAESSNLLENMSGSAQGLLTLVASLSLAGICEEFTFRGFLQTAIKSKYPLPVALFASSLAFGIFHLDLQGTYIIFGFLMGVVLGYVYHRWHSYTISAVAHATLNLIILAVGLL